jgi:hypothetical protein
MERLQMLVRRRVLLQVWGGHVDQLLRQRLDPTQPTRAIGKLPQL